MKILTEETAIQNLYKYALSKGGLFQGFVGGKFITNQTKCILQCGEGHQWSSASYGNLINKGSWCPTCNGNKRNTQQESKKRITDHAKTNGGKFIEFIGGKYKDNVTVCLMECSEGHRWESRYGNLVNSKSWCPYCATSGYNPFKVGYLYILSSEEGCMKIGVSNSPNNRFKSLKRSTPFEFNVLEVFKSNDGQFVLEMERKAHAMSISMGYKGFDGATEWFKHESRIIEFIRNTFEGI